MKLNIKIMTVSLAIVLFTGGCFKDKFDGMLNNPNSPTPEAANADLYLSEAQLNFAGFFNAASSIGMELTRYFVMYGPTYLNAYSPQTFDGIWSTAYTGVIKHTNALIPIAESQRKYVNVGMAKIMKAYTLMTLVDMFGDVPYVEANKGFNNTNPALSNGKLVYDSAIVLLDQAIADLNKTPGSYPGTQDLFYNASNAQGAAKWRKLAKTLKLRAYLQTRLVDNTAGAKITTLVNEGDIILAAADDFEFKYSSKQANPNSRHPRYNGNYTAARSAGDYVGTYFLWTMVNEKGISSNIPANDQSDPRRRYYFYRQRTNYADVNENSASCAFAAAPAHYPATMPYCLLQQGYWGRDHGDGSGIPPDGNLRTTVGVYPFGGEFDANQGSSVALTIGGKGAGIQPIWQSAYTDFLLAEAVLALSIPGNAKSLIVSGVNKSITKVMAYPGTVGVTPPASFVPTATQISNYITKVENLYDNATNTDQQMEVLGKEFYIALWGNGVDAYNNYRRTGKPGNMQLARLASPGSYIRSHYFPSSYVNRNLNAKQKNAVNIKVFWDTNPDNFIR